MGQNNEPASTVIKRTDLAIVGGRIEWLEEGTSIEVGLGESLLIGRGDNCNLRVQNECVSGVHLEVRPTADGICVRDLGSSNGTRLLDGTVVREVCVGGPTVFCLGGKGGAKIRVIPHSPKQLGEEFPSRIGDLVGEHPSMLLIMQQIEELARFDDMTVFIGGETGTGKELAARAIHSLSKRKNRPFVAVNCSALNNENMLEAELFGHERGAFTGAEKARKGLFVEADGGTILLDEIGDASPTLQKSILRAVQERVIRSVGGQERKINVRILAASCVDIPRACAEGKFRSDLRYRLCTRNLNLPPLRERSSDIPILTREVLRKIGRHDVELNREVIDQLTAHNWPGNVRELYEVVSTGAKLHTREGEVLVLDAAIAYAQPRTVYAPSGPTVETVPLVASGTDLADPLPFEDAYQHLLWNYWGPLVQRTGGNISEMARLSGKDRKSVKRYLGMLNGGIYSTVKRR